MEKYILTLVIQNFEYSSNENVQVLAIEGSSKACKRSVKNNWCNKTSALVRIEVERAKTKKI